MGSEKSFGIIFAVVFLVIALWPLTGGETVRIWSLYVCIGFLFAAYLTPRLLKPLNIIWFKFGLLLHKIVNPIMMGLVYVLTVLPTGVFIYLRGKDPLRLRRDKNTDSYWIKRESSDPTGESFKNQF